MMGEAAFIRVAVQQSSCVCCLLPAATPETCMAGASKCGSDCFCFQMLLRTSAPATSSNAHQRPCSLHRSVVLLLVFLLMLGLDLSHL